MVKPRAVRAGDRLAVVAPASPFSREEFDRGLAELRRLGFVPVYDDSVFARERYVAGAPETRAAALRAAWQDPTIAGIVGARGGYGSVQILPLLDPVDVRRARKPFIGYSDLTSLLTFITQGCGLVSFHGPTVVGRLGRGPAHYDPASLLALLGGAVVGDLTAAGVETVRAGDARGPLLGGTVSQLLGSLGTPFAFDPPRGHVLWLDEVGERPYRLDRMITQLAQAGVLARASAIVVGELPGCDEASGALTGRAVVADLLRGFSGPVLMGFPSGHTSGPALTLPLGVECRVVAGAAPRLVIEEVAVE